MAGQKTCNCLRIINRCRQSDPPNVRSHVLQSRQSQHQLIATFAFRKGVNFVDNDALQTREHAGGILIAGQQGQTFRGCQQNMRRVRTLAFLACGRCVACAILDANGQVRLGYGRP